MLFIFRLLLFHNHAGFTEALSYIAGFSATYLLMNSVYCYDTTRSSNDAATRSQSWPRILQLLYRGSFLEIIGTFRALLGCYNFLCFLKKEKWRAI